MQLFVCSQCNCVDIVELAFEDGQLPADSFRQQCSVCATDAWHGQFPHQPYDPEKDLVCNRENNIALG